MIYSIAQHEWLKLFKTGKLWKLLALCQFILGLIFYWLMEEFLFKTRNSLLGNNHFLGITEEVVHPLLAWTALFFFFITPLLAANSLAQERKSKVLSLYLTSAVSATDIILGKFIGLFLAESFLLIPIFLMPLLIVGQGNLDTGQFLSGLFGLSLLLASTLSFGIFISSLSKEPLIAALVIFVMLFLLSLLEWMSHFLPLSFERFKELALLYHCKNFLSGIIYTRDIIYYIAFSLIFLVFSIIRLDKEVLFRKIV